MGLEGKAKIVVYEIVGAFVLLLLLVVLRPLFISEVATAGTPYNISVTNSATGVTTQTTVTPATTLSSANADTIYTIVIFIVALMALVAIILTMMGKL